MLVLDGAILLRGGDAGISAAPLDPIQALQGAPGLGIMFAFLAFVGFEATAIYRSEAKDPERTVPRATYIAVIGIGVFYALSTWALTLGQGSEAVEAASKNPTAFVPALAARYVSPLLSDVIQVLLISSVFACILALHNVINRYQLSMSAKRLLPTFVGRIHPRHVAPSNASLVLTIASGAVLLVIVLVGVNPMTSIYGALSGCVGYGIIILMALTSLAVVVHFRRAPGRKPLWSSLVAPIVSLVLLAGIGVVSFANIDLLTGAPALSAVLIAYLVAATVVGMVLALTRRSERDLGPRPTSPAATKDETASLTAP